LDKRIVPTTKHQKTTLVPANIRELSMIT